jgi:hypothetical protein
MPPKHVQIKQLHGAEVCKDLPMVLYPSNLAYEQTVTLQLVSDNRKSSGHGTGNAHVTLSESRGVCIMRILKLLALGGLVLSVASIAFADGVDTQVKILDPNLPGVPGMSDPTTTIPVTDGNVNYQAVNDGAPITLITMTVPTVDVVGSLNCQSNVFLVLEFSSWNNDTCVFFAVSPGDNDGDANNPNCSVYDLDDCYGIQTGAGVSIVTPSGEGFSPALTSLTLMSNEPLPNVPEPASISLLALGLLALVAGRSWLRRPQAQACSKA